VTRHISAILVAILAFILIELGNSVYAQSAAPAVPGSEPTAVGDADRGIPGNLLDRLRQIAEETKRTMADVNELIQQERLVIEDAGPLFDKMIEDVRQAAELGAPDRDFVKQIENLIVLAQKDARAAIAAGDVEAARAFEERAKRFTDYKETALAVFRDSDRKIRIIKENKEFFVRRVKIRAYDAALAKIKEGLEVQKALNREVTKLAEDAPQDGVEP
jgi:hypothetical protein